MPSHLTLAINNQTPEGAANPLRRVFTPTTIKMVTRNGEKKPSFHIDLDALYAGALKLLALEAIRVLNLRPEREQQSMIQNTTDGGFIVTIDTLNFTLNYRNNEFTKGDIPILAAYNGKDLQFNVCFETITRWLETSLLNDRYSPEEDAFLNSIRFHKFSEIVFHTVQDKESDLIISTLDSILGKNRQCFQNSAPFGVTRNHV
jgi:hypothetical protein